MSDYNKEPIGIRFEGYFKPKTESLSWTNQHSTLPTLIYAPIGHEFCVHNNGVSLFEKYAPKKESRGKA
jgi:hypothetical protein